MSTWKKKNASNLSIPPEKPVSVTTRAKTDEAGRVPDDQLPSQQWF